MANDVERQAPVSPPETEMEHGTYEVIRNRLAAAGRELRSRLEQLNAARKSVFGAIETRLLATERVTTEHHCAPRDMTPLGNRFLFGYNVHLGLKSVAEPKDVLAAYEFRDHTFHALPLDLIADERFHREFAELYKYYRKARFAEFARLGPHLYMVFRVGDDARDVKTFKWLVEDDKLIYMGNRSEHEVRLPSQHEFNWTRTHRDMHAKGLHPHVNIEDRVFVETVGGDLTIKVENNTDSGEGIYREPVDDPDQTLDDAEIFYAIIGNLILLKVRPYQEPRYRYLVFSEKVQAVYRLDAIEHACLLLPEDQGIVFPNGYMLQTGECKIFESQPAELAFRQRVQSPNGEDNLFVFYHRDGIYSLLPYNIIEQKVDTPMLCNGYALFESGELVYFKAQDEPQRHHALQIWQTPFVGPDYQIPSQSDSYLYKVGNRDIVRGMAECREVLALLAKEDTYVNLFVDLARRTADILDSYHWLDHAEAYNLREILVQIRDAAQAAISEYEKVAAVRRSTAEQLKQVSSKTRQAIAAARSRRFEVIGDYVHSLGELRTVRGELVALRSLRYIDRPQVDALEDEVRQQSERLARDAVTFLLKPEALSPYESAVEGFRSRIAGLEKVADARKLEEEIGAGSRELEMLTEVVSNLKIDDATQRTAIIDRISALYSRINQVRAALKTRAGELMKVEGQAEFTSQLKLISQSIVGYLDACDTPERCDEYLTKMLVQVEELEGRFAEFDEFVVALAEKREEIYAAFESRKLQLVEARNRRATALAAAADRILKGIKGRVDQLQAVSEIHGYYAADLMIEKVRDIVRQLAELGDTVKVDDIESRLTTIREDAVRQLKDRQDLYEDGQQVLRFGNHRFSVNRQVFDLTTVLRDGEMYFHLTGTNYFDRITEPEFLATREVWSQEVVSETAEVYRGEYLAYQILCALDGGDAAEMERLRQADEAQLTAYVQQFMASRYDEAYVKGVHDHDAAKLLRVLLELRATAGLLRYHPRARALARVFWHQFPDADRRGRIAAQLRGFGAARQLFPGTEADAHYVAELAEMIGRFAADTRLFDVDLSAQAAEYLSEELTGGGPFIISGAARDLYQAFQDHLRERKALEGFRAAVESVRSDAASAFRLARDWIEAFLATRGDAIDCDYADKLAALVLAGMPEGGPVIEAAVVQDVPGMVGNHRLIQGSTYRLDYSDFLLKLERYQARVVPQFEAFRRQKQLLLERERERMRLDEFRPRVLTSFVRNKLIDEVYLPLVGDNLAKQLGVVGEQKRTDRMGLLLVISPPGYGKTTLMEYIANRLGIVFMKINGPALGHQVTSLDPAETTNAAAREEIEKFNLAFEMGDNVMIYLDDIQHCNPELLQKFISLCDAQRKVEGVYRGRTRTYDLRGKKVAVVMAGNPYTESGEKFRIPDMLANRADTYNLGEIIGPKADLFEMSYLENALTSNPVLARLASRSQKDVYVIIRMAETNSQEGVELEASYSLAEVNEMVEVMRKLMRVRDVVLRVNQEYIRSAATADEYRTEPPFRLQGSYRNMNRIAERVVAIMTRQELDDLILASYTNDAQTLTTGAESNLLKFKELTGRLNTQEAARWEEIKKTYRRNVQLRGVGEDEKFGQLIVQLTSFSDGLDQIRQTLSAGMARMLDEQARTANGDGKVVTAAFAPQTLDSLASLVRESLTAIEETARPAPAPSGPPEVHIVSRVPSAILNVLRQQFRLMHGWLEPLRRQSQRQDQTLQSLEQLVQENLASLRELISRLEESARTGSGGTAGPAEHQLDSPAE